MLVCTLNKPTAMPTNAATLLPSFGAVLRWALGLLLCAAAPVWSASSASSASSDAGSASVGSLSTSIEKSSTSSSGGEKKTAAGEYRVVEIAQAADAAAGPQAAAHPRAGLARLKLQSMASAGEEFYLYLPQPTLAQAQISTGQLLRADERSYGLAFSHAGSQEPFFLVLEDGWQRQLQTQVLKL